MKNYQRDFIKFAIDKQVLTFGEFKLKSGRVSPYFFNSGQFNTGKEIAKLGCFYAAALMEIGIEFDLLFGLAYKGIPIVTTTAVALSNHYDKDIPYCFNRKKAKNYGEKGILVGSLLQGRVILVDDVITAGTTIRESMSIINAQGASLVGVLIALDRQERDDQKIFAVQEDEQKHQCKVCSIVTISDVITYLQGEPEWVNKVGMMKKYCISYGIKY